MNLVQIIRLLLRNLNYIIGAAIITGGTMVMLTAREKKQYATHTIINTGLVSGYSIESSQGGKTDYNFTNNELQNLIRLATARETILELSMHLLLHIVRNGESDSICNRDNYLYTIEYIPENIISRINAFDNNIDALNFLLNEYHKGGQNPIYKVAESGHELIGIEFILEHLKVIREGTSDMIRMEYKTIDPSICKQTLMILTDLFVQKHQKIKENQSTSVLDFFEEATSKSARLLSSAEQELLQFQENNRIINYYEQTRFISGKKEDLDERYQLERMNLLAADSSQKAIETQLLSMREIPELHLGLIKMKRELEQSLNASSIQPTNEASSIAITSESSALNLLAIKELKAYSTPEGLKGAALLEEWLEQKLLKHQSEARLSLMRERQQDFDLIYDRFAPLGSKLKDIDRKIGIAEKEYLENLHSYNQARLHRYNMMMTTNLKVIDPPFKPVKPEKSKRLLMILLGTFSGVITLIGVLVTASILDSTLKNMARAKEAIGLDVVGMLPLQKGSSIELEWMNQLSMKHIESAILLNLGIEPSRIVVTSMLPLEGKSTVINLLKKQINSDFLEWPALLHSSFSPKETDDIELIMLVCKANRQWSDADSMMLERLQKLSSIKILVLLNGASIDAMEHWIGEVKKPRSAIRKYVKRLLKNGFSRIDF